MFKIQDINRNNNSERYIFHPRSRLSKTLHGSFSGLISSRENNNKQIMYGNNYYENTKINFKEDAFYRLKQVPPVYFYRKIHSPYKYNILSVPEYLVKTNEERHFMDKLNQLIINDSDRKTLNNLIINKKKEKKFKDRYKPPVLDVQNILRYRPNLYSNSFLFDKRSNSVLLKDNNILSHEHKSNTIDVEKIFDNNNCESKEKEEKKDVIIDNNEQNEHKNDENKEKEIEEEKEKEKKDEISEEDQIKYKYHISDIYNKRKEKVITNKSAEKYLFKKYENRNSNSNENYFYNTSKSKSDWIPNRSFITKMNSFSSVSYNIISPLYKGYNKFISPSELNKNNLYNESPAFHRTKSISEFIDLTRVSASNTLDCFNRKNKILNFKLRNSVATNQADEYHINRDLIEKPI